MLDDPFEYPWTHPETGEELTILYDMSHRDGLDTVEWWSILYKGIVVEDNDNRGDVWEQYGDALWSKMIAHAIYNSDFYD